MKLILFTYTYVSEFTYQVGFNNQYPTNAIPDGYYPIGIFEYGFNHTSHILLKIQGIKAESGAIRVINQGTDPVNDTLTLKVICIKNKFINQ